MQGKENVCAVLKGAKDIRLEKRIIGDPGPNEVLISVHSVGICGTDVETWRRAEFQGNPLHDTIPGHECSGVVCCLGSHVENVKQGDRVAIYPIIGCNQCIHCQNRNVTVCPDFKVLSLTNHPYGGCMRYIIHPANLVFRMPDSVSFEEAALVEPLGVTLRSCIKSNITTGSNVLIAGAGPLGLCALLNANARGARTTCVVDKDEYRLTFAKRLGASYTYLVSDQDTVPSVVKQIHDIMGINPGHAIDTTGVEMVIDICINTVERGGSVVLLGLTDEQVSIPALTVVMREIKIEGSVGPEPHHQFVETIRFYGLKRELPKVLFGNSFFGRPHDVSVYGHNHHILPTVVNLVKMLTHRFQEILELIANGKLNVKALVTARYSLSDCQRALEAANNKEGIKIMIDCTQE